MSQRIILNTAQTLSINSSPGEDKRFPSVTTESVFTFGDFRIQRDLTPNFLSGDSLHVSFSNFGTLNSLSKDSLFDSTAVVNITTNDLNPKKNDANSYAYFSSFYTKVASAINDIVNSFPYGILAYRDSTGSTILNYSNSVTGTSSFNIPTSAITNQGNIIYSSGYTASTSVYTLFNDYNQFEIELSSSTRYSQSYSILNYSYDPSTSLMNFTIDGYLFTGSTATTTVGVYILPSQYRYYQYKKTLGNLEYQLLFEQKFMVPNPDDDTFENQDFEWPKTIDGFNPDWYGDSFDDYRETLLRSCSLIDEIKTNWMIRTMIPENYIELDSQDAIYRKLIIVYSEELDKIKQYIDGIAFAHSVNYHDEETIPNKFLHRLSKLFGWEPINEFNDVDIFEYLASEDDDGFTISDYNFDLWKKILININWLYKKKGTREALEFIFKLMGAPDCLVHFNELVYRVRQSATGVTASNLTSIKINDDTGYPNYENGSNYIFQEGGPGRGNGDNYIRQWEPEYNPEREIDNKKIHTGNTEVYGTADIMNSKQINIELSPAAAIECDVNEWYNLGLIFGSTAGVPAYVDIAGLQLHIPSTISGMTFENWIEYVYTNAIDPKNRKTIGSDSGNHTHFYSSLKDIYLAYYYWNYPNTVSNRLNFRKLQAFLALIERNFGAYIQKLIPATTIIESDGILYRNTVFNRQKFVYPTGINAGSEFQFPSPLSPDLNINAVSVQSTFNDILNPQVNAVSANIEINDNLNPQVNAVSANIEINDNYNKSINSISISNGLNLGINPTINAVVVNSSIENASVLISYVAPDIAGFVSNFPVGGTPQAEPPRLPVAYHTKTTSSALSNTDNPSNV